MQTHRAYYRAKLAFGCMVLATMLAACYPAHKATASRTELQNDLCAEAWLPYPNQPHPMWEEINATGISFNAGLSLPKKYRTYRTNPDTLRQFFHSAKKAQGDYALIFPVTKGCEAFLMRVSGAMSAVLQAKYPDIISLQGNGTTSKTADLRLDWNGQELKGELSYQGNLYFITPAQSKQGLVYLFYSKDDTNEIKQPFEGGAGNRNNTDNDH